MASPEYQLIEEVIVTWQEWLKGGLRYRSLRKNVKQYVQGKNVYRLVIAVQGKRWKGFGLAREYAIALTEDAVVVLKIGFPAGFSSELLAEYLRVRPDEVKLVGRDLLIDRQSFTPIPFHKAEAKRLVEQAHGG